jgi:hypothetical protein
VELPGFVVFAAVPPRPELAVDGDVMPLTGVEPGVDPFVDVPVVVAAACWDEAINPNVTPVAPSPRIPVAASATVVRRSTAGLGSIRCVT